MRSAAVALLIFFAGHSTSRAFTLNSATDSNLQGWAGGTVTFNVNYSSCPANINQLIDDALAVWNNVPTSNLVVKRGVASSTTPTQLINGTATDVPVIVCDPNFGTTVNVDANSIAGVGGARTRQPGEHIAYGYLILNVQSGAGANITLMSTTIATLIAAHEIGHALGFGHSADSAALMYYNASAKEQLNLAQDDVDAITYLYPRNEASGDQFLGGCGLVKSLGSGGRPSQPPGLPTALAIVLLSPMILLFGLRDRRRAFAKIR